MSELVDEIASCLVEAAPVSASSIAIDIVYRTGTCVYVFQYTCPYSLSLVWTPCWFSFCHGLVSIPVVYLLEDSYNTRLEYTVYRYRYRYTVSSSIAIASYCNIRNIAIAMAPYTYHREYTCTGTGS